MSWPESEFTPAPAPKGAFRARAAGLGGSALIAGGAIAIAVAVLAQQHAPQPAAGAAGATGPAGKGPSLHRSLPVSVDIPAIGVHSQLLRLGVNADGTVQVPPLTAGADQAAWLRYSATPGQIGASVIEGHVDSYRGAAVFYRLGALRPGDTIDVTLADGVTGVFRVTGVREYAKDKFPAKVIYSDANFAALRLITCGGAFDYTTGHYLSSTVVFASLTASRHPSSH